MASRLPYFTEIAPSVLPCPKTQEHQSTCVDAAIHYGVQLVHSDPTLSCYAISRRLPPLHSLALRLRNTKVPVWTHDSIGYPKMDISHWDAAIHYGVQLAQYCDQNLSAIGTRQFTMAFSLPNIVIKTYLVTLFYGDCPLCAPLPQDSGTLKYLSGLMSP